MNDVEMIIEDTREELVDIANNENSFLDKSVLKKSRELDDLLNEYMEKRGYFKDK